VLVTSTLLVVGTFVVNDRVALRTLFGLGVTVRFEIVGGTPTAWSIASVTAPMATSLAGASYTASASGTLASRRSLVAVDCVPEHP